MRVVSPSGSPPACSSGRSPCHCRAAGTSSWAPAGGPLLVGLGLGVVSRTGPITWQIPHAANLVLRQLGILVFLACAGLASGTTFADAIVTRHGLNLAVAGVLVAGAFAALVPLAAQVVLRHDVVYSAGMLAGVETQPAALAYANERTAGDVRVDGCVCPRVSGSDDHKGDRRAVPGLTALSNAAEYRRG